jgi:hypothetical protein
MNRISSKAHIHKSFLRGFRIPHMDQGGNTHLRKLKDLNFAYDATPIVDIGDSERKFRYWPHTLDYEAAFNCSSCPIADKTKNQSYSDVAIKSFWVVPSHFLNIDDPNVCPRLFKNKLPGLMKQYESCRSDVATTSDIIFKDLKNNFDMYYKANKAPFIINIELDWFNDETKAGVLKESLLNFMDYTNSIKNNWNQRDIFFVSIEKIIEWMRFPNNLKKVSNQWLWDCDDVSYDYDRHCNASYIDGIRESFEELVEQRKRNNTLGYAWRSETLFRNGVLGGVTITFIIAFLITFFYDKFSK